MFARKNYKTRIRFQRMEGSIVKDLKEFEYPNDMPLPRPGEFVHYSGTSGAHSGTVVNVSHHVHGNNKFIVIICNY